MHVADVAESHRTAAMLSNALGTPEISCDVQAETDFCYNVLENTEQLQEQLYREMRGRIQEADQSAPIRQAEQQSAISNLNLETCC